MLLRSVTGGRPCSSTRSSSFVPRADANSAGTEPRGRRYRVQVNGAYPSSVPSAAFVPIVVALVVVAIDLWVYADAKSRAQQGRAVTVRAGALVVSTPTAWFIGCLLLWVIFFPLYLTSRS